MSGLFADSYYYLALLNTSDQAHVRVATFTERFSGSLVTTAWVLTEIADGMVKPGHRTRFSAFVDILLLDSAVKVVPPSESLFDAGLNLYKRRPDKEWPLTDCISFVVMQDEVITQALTADRHFTQAGFEILFPE